MMYNCFNVALPTNPRKDSEYIRRGTQALIRLHPPIVACIITLICCNFVAGNTISSKEQVSRAFGGDTVWRSVVHLSDAEENSMAGMTFWCFTTMALFSRQYTLARWQWNVWFRIQQSVWVSVQLIAADSRILCKLLSAEHCLVHKVS